MSEDIEDSSSALSALPPGVGAISFGPDGKPIYHLDPFLVHMRWSDVRVDSASFSTLPPHDRLYLQAQAFISAAILLCEGAGEAGPELRWPQASVCYYCLHLSTELFLKACILTVGHVLPAVHEIGELRAIYERLLPDEMYAFQTPWNQSVKDLHATLGFEVYQGVDRSPDQLFRYGMDKQGRASSSVHFFTPGYLFNYMTHLRGRWAKIWESVSTMGGG